MDIHYPAASGINDKLEGEGIHLNELKECTEDMRAKIIGEFQNQEDRNMATMYV